MRDHIGHAFQFAVRGALPIDQQLAVIYTISDGAIVKGDYFMSWAEAREAAGLE